MADRHRTCAHCGKQFTYEIARGTDRKYCSAKCASDKRNSESECRYVSLEKCSVERCENRANRIKAGLCEKHYARMRRNGTTEKQNVVKPGSIEQSGGGYLMVYAPDHPLRKGSSPRVYEHRKVFYDANGSGPFNCHVCGAVVTWDDMHVDHLNDDVKDNRLENLAPACPTCNQWRGKDKSSRSIKIRRGKHITAHGVTMCESDWSRHLGITRNAFNDRMTRGASIDEALRPREGKSGPQSRSERIPLSSLEVISDIREVKTEWAV